MYLLAVCCMVESRLKDKAFVNGDITKGQLRKAVEIAKAGCNVILDWGFWKRSDREYTTEYFESSNINVEWHYIDIDDLSWEENIKERNEKIDEGLNVIDFYVTDGLKKKLLGNWETPNKEEIDIWYSFVRNK